MPANATPSRKTQLLELLIFLFLIVPSMLTSFMAVRGASAGFALGASETIVRDIALVCLILYFLWRNGETVWRIGWNFGNGAREIGWGLLLFVPTSVAVGMLDQWLRSIGFSGPILPPPRILTPLGTGEFVLAGFLVAVVAVAEETIFRGYLILRFLGVTGSVIASALLSSFVFSLGHGYEGTSGAASVGVMGLIFAVVYLWRGSLVAPMVMHFLQDFIGIVLVPLLFRK